MSHPVNWFQIGGPNGKDLQRFYKTVFGWKMQPNPGPTDMMMVAPEKGGVPGGIGTSQNHMPSVAVYVSVSDIDAAFGKIHESGGRVAMPKMDLPGGMGTIAGFTDPAGNWIGLWAPGKGGAAPKRTAAAAKKKSGAAKKKAVAAPKKKAGAAKKK